MQKHRGFTLMEILIAGAILLIFASGVIASVLGNLKNERFSEERVRATAYAEEGLEAVHSLKKRDFSLISDTDGSGIIREGDGLWKISGSSDTLDQFTRVVVIEPVLRNGSGDIDTSGTEDPVTKKVTVTVNWTNDNRPESLEISGYFTYWEEPL